MHHNHICIIESIHFTPNANIFTSKSPIGVGFHHFKSICILASRGRKPSHVLIYNLNYIMRSSDFDCEM